MAYAIYHKGRKIRKITGNPRAPINQKGMIVWSETKSGVKNWVKRYGNKPQKERYL